HAAVFVGPAEGGKEHEEDGHAKGRAGEGVRATVAHPEDQCQPGKERREADHQGPDAWVWQVNFAVSLVVAAGVVHAVLLWRAGLADDVERSEEGDPDDVD